jgi:molecular chaperone GrpE
MAVPSQPRVIFAARHFSTEPPKTEEGAKAEAKEEAPKAVDESAALHAEIKDLKERVLRSLAEEENVRRIAKRDVENAHAYANASFAKAMLEVADDLERAIAIVPAEKRKSDDATLKSLVEGLEMTDKNLHKIFQKFGIAKFGKIDETFDPHHHDALYQIPDASKPNTIGNVVKAGYKLKDRVIRAAQVGARVDPGN